MKISVVILNWNRPQDTIAAVESVLRQDYNSFDVIVWDNASTDGSHELLQSRFGSDARVRLVAADGNYGVAGGRNRAFALCTGNIIASLDSDAAFDGADALARMAACFDRAPDAGAISFEVRRPDGHLMWPFSRPSTEWRTREFETFRVDGCSFAVRRQVFEQVHGFAEHFSPYGAEDAHFAFKVLGCGHRVLYVPSVAVVHAFSPKGRTATQFKMHVRNCLSIPLELFPMPHALLSYGNSARSLLRDALEQRQLSAFAAGCVRSLADFRHLHRQPMSNEGWIRFRHLVREEKNLKKTKH